MTTQGPPQRRQLQFTKIDDITDDAGRLVLAEQKGKLRQLGNWTLGQSCGHIAGMIDYSYDGLPIKITWLAKLVARRFRRKFIYRPMNPGGSIPRVPGGTLATERLSTAEGLSRLKQACARLKRSVPKTPHAVFGPLNADEWKNFHLRHAELHLSFLRDD
jgi:hypothetical protein